MNMLMVMNMLPDVEHIDSFELLYCCYCTKTPFLSNQWKTLSLIDLLDILKKILQNLWFDSSQSYRPVEVSRLVCRLLSYRAA